MPLLNEISVREAGARGGHATFKRRGREFLSEIGKKGGRRTAELYRELLAEFGRKGGRPRRPSLNQCLGEETSDRKEADSGRPSGLLPRPHFSTDRVTELTPMGDLKRYRELQRIRKRLIDTANSPRDKALMAIATTEGMHISEVTRLEESHIDRTRETLTIVHLKELVKLKCPNCGAILVKRQVFCPNCGNKIDQVTQEKVKKYRQRIISVDRDTLKLVDEYLKWRLKFPYRGPLIFPITRQRAWQLIEKIGRRAEIR